LGCSHGARREWQEPVIEIHSLGWTRDAHPPALPLPSHSASSRRLLAGLVTIGGYDHVAPVFRQFEAA
jgi:hypothetical protein